MNRWLIYETTAETTEPMRGSALYEGQTVNCSDATDARKVLAYVGQTRGGTVREYAHVVARSDLVKALLRSHQRGDDAAFHRAAKELIDDERRKRHDLVAEQLEAILEEPGHRRRPPHVSSLRPLPKTRDDLPLISLEEPGVSFHDLVLPDSVVSVFESLVEEFRQRSALRAHGVSPRSSVLLVGPPGSGKSASAEATAAQLGLPVARVRLATIVSSYLGETARHLEQIFSFLDVGSWVLIFDEHSQG